MAQSKIRLSQLLDAEDGYLVADGSAGLEAIKLNRAATTAPAGANDNTQGYAVGSFWYDTTADRSYVCLDAATGAAVWKEVSLPGNIATFSGSPAANLLAYWTSASNMGALASGGNAGEALVSNGPGSPPSFQPVATGTGPGLVYQPGLGMPFSINPILNALVKLGTGEISVVTPSCLQAMANHATNPVVALRQDNAGGSAQLLDLYHDHVAGAAGPSFVRFYRDAAGTPLLVFNVDTRGAAICRPQSASGTVCFAVEPNVAASIGNVFNLLGAYLFDDGGNNQNWANFAVEQRVVTDGAEQGKLYVQLMAAGTLRSVWIVDEDTDSHSWLLNNGTRMLLNASFLRTSGGLRTGGNADPTAIVSGATLFSGVTPHAEMLTGTGGGTYEDLVVIRHSNHDGTAVLRRLGLLLKLSGEASTSQSDRCGGLVLESNDATALNPHLFVVVEGQKTVEFPDGGGLNVITGNLAVGGTDITATPAELNILDGATLSTSELNILDGVTAATAELNLLDITGRASGDALLATGATSAAWRTRAQQKADTRVGFAAYLNKNVSTATGGWARIGFVDNDLSSIFDSDSMLIINDGAGSNSGKFTIPTGMTGAWRVSAHVAWDANATGIRAVHLIESDGSPTLVYSTHQASGTGDSTEGFSAVMTLTAGVTYQFEVYQSSGGNLNILGNYTYISAEFLGA